MLTAVVVLPRSIGLLCRGHRAAALENVALRQQLTALRRTTKRAHLQTRDRSLKYPQGGSWRFLKSVAFIIGTSGAQPKRPRHLF